MEQCRNERAGERGDPRDNPKTNGIVWHDSHMRKSAVTRPGIEPGSPWWEGEQANRSATPRRTHEVSNINSAAEWPISSKEIKHVGWSGAVMLGRSKRQYPEKTHRQAASSSTIPSCEDPGVNPPVIEPVPPWWEASAIATAPPLPLVGIVPCFIAKKNRRFFELLRITEDSAGHLRSPSCCNSTTQFSNRMMPGVTHSAGISNQASSFNMLPWPTKSPDLSPVKNVWDRFGWQLRPAVTTADLEDQLCQLWPDPHQDNFRMANIT
ncbi:hypothetical protein PR048_032208 [Dryococelus australis]|uniref:Uncharacterized protein n=1 Tax=Dryococelus australis TaxID=614101 RepID=A0ABQ9G1K7_9NEOP|nr:hypothetical protein PR048_032208 [Dryococelus australis]